MRAAGGMALLGAMLALAILVPVESVQDPAPRSPVDAAQVVERELPPLGLVWGRVRAWARVGSGWVLTWQPAHGAWLLRAWVPDEPESVRWRLQAAPWLPGVRLSQQAASFVAGGEDASGIATERIGRRDWQFGESRVLGALPAGSFVPSVAARPAGVWSAFLLGLLLAGGVAIAALPGLPARGWALFMTAAWVMVVVLLPWLAPLGYGSFDVAVRPWIAQLAFMGQVVLVAGAVALAAWRFPLVRGGPLGVETGIALAAGLLAGRLEPPGWTATVAGLSVHAPVWLMVAAAAGWLAALAGQGLRELIWFSPVVRRGLAMVAGAVAVATAGPWLGPVVAVSGAAVVPRPRATWVATAVMWGWLVGATFQSCAWEPPLRDALAMLLVGAVAVSLLTLRDARAPGPAAAR